MGVKTAVTCSRAVSSAACVAGPFVGVSSCVRAEFDTTSAAVNIGCSPWFAFCFGFGDWPACVTFLWFSAVTPAGA